MPPQSPLLRIMFEHDGASSERYRFSVNVHKALGQTLRVVGWATPCSRVTTLNGSTGLDCLARL